MEMGSSSCAEDRGRNEIPSSGLTMLLHDSEELDDDLGAWADQNLALAGLLGVVDGIEAVVEHGSLDHFGGIGEILRALVAARGVCGGVIC